ncbi:unnamed protein product [Prunus armeniaca]
MSKSSFFKKPRISSVLGRARLAIFKGQFLSPPVTDSSKTGHVRTTTLPSSSPSPSLPRSAAVVAGISHETGGVGQIFLKLSPAVSLPSDHQISRVRYGFLAIFHDLAAGWVGFQKFQA